MKHLPWPPWFLGNSLPEVSPNCNRAWRKIWVLHSVIRGEEGNWIPYTQDQWFEGAEWIVTDAPFALCCQNNLQRNTSRFQPLLSFTVTVVRETGTVKISFAWFPLPCFHLTPDMRLYHSGQADNRQRNPTLLFLLKNPNMYPFWILLNCISQST